MHAAVPLALPAPSAPFETHVVWARSVPLTVPDRGAVDGRVTGRVVEDAVPWDYPALARELVAGGRGPVLDLGTGSGGLLASFAPLPAGSAATEAWPPHLPVARRRLTPLGVDVRATARGDEVLPFLDAQFDVVLARHEEFDPDEVRRVLRPGGVFLTEQVDSRDGVRACAALGAELPWDPDSVTLDGAVDVLGGAGFVVDVAREHEGLRRYRDLGSLLGSLRTTASPVPELAPLTPEAVARFEAPLRALHLHFAAGHEFVDEAPRFLVVARAPY